MTNGEARERAHGDVCPTPTCSLRHRLSQCFESPLDQVVVRRPELLNLQHQLVPFAPGREIIGRQARVGSSEGHAEGRGDHGYARNPVRPRRSVPPPRRARRRRHPLSARALSTDGLPCTTAHVPGPRSTRRRTSPSVRRRHTHIAFERTFIELVTVVDGDGVHADFDVTLVPLEAPPGPAHPDPGASRPPPHVWRALSCVIRGRPHPRVRNSRRRRRRRAHGFRRGDLRRGAAGQTSGAGRCRCRARTDRTPGDRRSRRTVAGGEGSHARPGLRTCDRHSAPQ